MARRRLSINANLPPNTRCRGGYYSWVNPISRTEHGLGRDPSTALGEANRRNELIGAPVRLIPSPGLRLQEILELAKPVAELSAVYFLIAGPDIIYVGQSENVYQRLATHLADGVIGFDRYHIEPCDRSLLLVLETQYILQFKPRCNRTHHARRVYANTTVQSQ